MKSEIEKLIATKAELEEELRKRNVMLVDSGHSSRTRREIIARLKERQENATREIRARKDEIASFEKRLVQLMEERNGQVAGETSCAPCCAPTGREEKKRVLRRKQEKPSIMTNTEALRQLSLRLNKYAERTSTDADEEINGDIASDFSVDHVKVSYLPTTLSASEREREVGGDDESAAFSGTFRLSPEYTFKMLLEDAKIFFGIPKKIAIGASLRDGNDRLWPPRSRIMKTMSKVLAQRRATMDSNSSIPRIRLVLTQTEEEGEIEEDDDSKSDDNELDPKEYLKPERVRQRRRENVQMKLFRISKEKTPLFHDDVSIEREIMDSYGHTFEESGAQPELKDDLKFEMHTRMQGDCLMMCLHIIFVLAITLPLVVGRGWIYTSNDIEISFRQRLSRSVSTAQSVDGSYATAVNRSHLATQTQVMDFLKGPLLDAVFQCGGETQGSCATNASSASQLFSNYALLGTIKIVQYRTDSTLGRISDNATCDGSQQSRPYLYWTLSGNADSIDGSSIRCYSRRNYHLSASLRVVVEMPPTGAIHVQSSVAPMTYSDFNLEGTLYAVLILCDVYMFFFMGSLLYVSLVKIRIYGVQRFMRVIWNVIDVFLLISISGCLYISRHSLSYYDNVYEEIRNNDSDPQIGYTHARRHRIDMWVLCSLSTIAMFRTLKYFSRNSQVEHIWNVINLVRNELGTFVCMLLVYVAAFASWCRLTMGVHVPKVAYIWNLCIAIVEETLSLQSLYDSRDFIGPRNDHRPIDRICMSLILLMARTAFFTFACVIFLTAFIQVRSYYHKNKERTLRKKALSALRNNSIEKAEWDPSHIKTREFWTHFLFGFKFSKRKKEDINKDV
eukprot:g2092.t1